MQRFRAEICRINFRGIPYPLGAPYTLFPFTGIYSSTSYSFSGPFQLHSQLIARSPCSEYSLQHILLSWLEAWLPPWHHFSSALLLQPSAIWTSRPDLHVASHLCMQLFSVVLWTSHKQHKGELFISEFDL